MKERKILCPKCRTEKKKPWWNWGVAAWPTMAKVQQSSTWIRAPKGAARKGGGEREVRRIFKMLREIWCYESPKKEKVSHTFKHLTTNIKSYNEDKI